MKMAFKQLLVFIFLWLQQAVSLMEMSSGYELSKPGCSTKCGDVDIPYPFGFKNETNCFFNNHFRITCNETLESPKPFYGQLELLNIDIQHAELRLNFFIATDCYDINRNPDPPYIASGSLGVFTFSNTRNKFVAIGCDTYGSIEGTNYSSGCSSKCDNIDNVINGSCTGIGCCQIPIPTGLTNYNAQVASFQNHTKIWDMNPCSYAFLVEEKWFNFSSLDLKNSKKYSNKQAKVPVSIDWGVGDESCEEAKKNPTTYLCGENSNCHNSSNGNGYRCNCSDGYVGNPYLSHGCQDIDECKDPTLNICLPSQCINKNKNTTYPLGYRCSCPPHFHGDGKKEGRGCDKNETTLWIKVSIGIGLGILFLLVISSCLYWGFKKRKLMLMKERFYRQNGGLMLERIMKEQNDSDLNVKIFTDEELKKATDNYDESRIIGRGGFGIVYKGILTGKTAVAIKKSKIVDQSQTEQFVNEVAVLSQIRHRNVVKLLGCCLENEVPLLVYEFVTNGTLFHHLHDEGRVSLLSWDTRLRIAAEVATSLSYLHSEASIPIIHRDVKSMNILLDDNHTAKVADFGTSRLVPLDQTQLSTLVQGTLGYLDPEYFHTSQLTEKSDVYSFGVLLAELLTGKKALSYERPIDEINLATYFISAMKQDRVFQILEEHLASQASVEQVQQVAELTKRCLRVKGEKRPTMKEVVIILDGLRSSVKHPSVFDNESNGDENVYLLAEATKSCSAGADMTGFDSLMELVPTSSGR